MGDCNKIKIVSLHGYDSSHETGYEAALRDALSDEYNFECVDLLGHASGKDSPDFYSIAEVVSDAVGKIGERVDGKTFLIGTSFGAYPVLEYLGNNSDVRGAVFVKPMVDIGYTFAAAGSQIDAIRGVLDIEGAVKKYAHGTKDLPFDVCVPSLFFSGRNDVIVGDSEFVSDRVIGRGLRYFALEGGHSDNRDDDIGKVVRETKYFFAGFS